jgi:hypothetical protein
MPTTKEIIGDYIDLQVDLMLTEDNEEQLMIEEKISETQGLMKRKVDNIDRFVVSIETKGSLINAEIDSLKKEIDRLKNRKQACSNLKDFLNKQLLPAVVREMGNDGVFETNTSKYTLYKSYGKVEVNQELAKEYVNIKMEEVVDKKRARKDAIEAAKRGEKLPAGLSIEKVDRIRRT